MRSYPDRDEIYVLIGKGYFKDEDDSYVKKFKDIKKYGLNKMVVRWDYILL